MKDWYTINWSSLTEVSIKSGVMQNNFCLQRRKKKKSSGQNTALRLLLHLLCINSTKSVLLLRRSNQLSKVWQLTLPDKILWAKIRLNKNKAMLFSNSQFSLNVLGIVSWGQRTLSRRFCEHNITYKLTCGKVSTPQF